MSRFIFFCCLFLLALQCAAQQKNKESPWSAVVQIGVNFNDEILNKPGKIFKIETEYRIYKQFYSTLTYTRVNENTFPDNLRVFSYNSGVTETQLIDEFKKMRITRSDWINQKKGFYSMSSADMGSMAINYKFKLGKKFYIGPQIGLGVLRSNLVTMGLFDATFDSQNDVLVNGKVEYDFRISTLLMAKFSIFSLFKINENWGVLLLIEDLRDIKPIGKYPYTETDGYNYYEAKNITAGVKYSFPLKARR